MRYAVWGIAAWLLSGALLNLNTSGKLTAKGNAKGARLLIASAMVSIGMCAVLAFAGFDL